MNEEVKQLEIIHAEDKKAKKKFYLIMLGSIIVGALFGIGMVFCENLLEGLSYKSFARTMVLFLPVIQCLSCIIATVLFTHFYRKGLAEKAQWNGDVNETYDKMENFLGIALSISNLSFVILLTLFGITFSLLDATQDLPDHQFALWFILDTGSLFYSIFFVMISQKKVVNLEKIINPEKQGSVYETGFQKKWLNSCDEMEQLYIYKAAFHSFKRTSGTCMLLWLFTFFTSTVFHTGIFPVLIVGIIWFVSMLSYLTEAHKLSKHKPHTL